MTYVHYYVEFCTYIEFVAELHKMQESFPNMQNSKKYLKLTFISSAVLYFSCYILAFVNCLYGSDELFVIDKILSNLLIGSLTRFIILTFTASFVPIIAVIFAFFVAFMLYFINLININVISMIEIDDINYKLIENTTYQMKVNKFFGQFLKKLLLLKLAIRNVEKMSDLLIIQLFISGVGLYVSALITLYSVSNEMIETMQHLHF